ncbi:MAG TPA: ribosome maturation factor RimM [Ktedonobacterales bacterium]|nr:ribosome maturation factor RimM [Ktedonobacterales bacterium]
MSKPPHRQSETPAESRRDSPGPRPDQWVVVGEIVGVFGVAGELKVRPLTDFPERFERPEAIYVGEKRTPYESVGGRQQGRQVILRLAGVETPEAGALLRGERIYVPGDAITPLAGDRFYIHDVIGLRVERADGAVLGVVTDVVSGGANDLYVVEDSQTHAETLLPAVKEFVRSIDLASGVMVVTPIPGLFDDDFEEAT